MEPNGGVELLHEVNTGSSSGMLRLQVSQVRLHARERSNGDDRDERLEADEVIGVAGVQIQTVGVRSGRDE